MLPFTRLYGFESSTGYLQPIESDGGGSKVGMRKSKSTTSAYKNHSEAERRRPHRINAHLATLRSLLPNTKSDKASLLGEVVKRAKELSKRVDDVASLHDEAGSVRYFGNEPGELDKATASYCDGENEPMLMKSTVCCDDRPGLNRDIAQVIHSIRAKKVRAQMVTFGGRTKIIGVMRWPVGDDGARKEEEISALERALKAAVGNRALVGSEMDPNTFGPQSGSGAS